MLLSFAINGKIDRRLVDKNANTAVHLTCRLFLKQTTSSKKKIPSILKVQDRLFEPASRCYLFHSIPPSRHPVAMSIFIPIPPGWKKKGGGGGRELRSKTTYQISASYTHWQTDRRLLQMTISFGTTVSACPMTRSASLTPNFISTTSDAPSTKPFH